MIYSDEERQGLHSRGTRGCVFEEHVGLHSRGTRGYTQSRNARVYTVDT